MADIDNLVSQVRTRSGGEFQNKLQVLKSFLNIKENINLILFDKSITELSLASQESTVDLDSKKGTPFIAYHPITDIYRCLVMS